VRARIASQVTSSWHGPKFARRNPKCQPVTIFEVAQTPSEIKQNAEHFYIRANRSAKPTLSCRVEAAMETAPHPPMTLPAKIDIVQGSFKLIQKKWRKKSKRCDDHEETR
jgi:hypothetical protein